MSVIQRECVVFDPVRITTTSKSPNFIIDTWHRKGLMRKSLFSALQGLNAVGTIRIDLSSGMYLNCPLVKVGIQIGDIKAIPVDFALVDDGAAPLLFGSEFMEMLFDMQAKSLVSDNSVPSPADPANVSIDASGKYAPETLGIRLVPQDKTIDALQLELFLRSVRKIHNIAVIATTPLDSFEGWQRFDSDYRRVQISSSIEVDQFFADYQTLKITWVENGSIWISLTSGSKKALSWLAQIFEKTTDARLRQTMASADSASEDAAIKRLTRQEIANAKNREQERLAAKYIKETRLEWHKTVLNEIDFTRKLTEKITDAQVREVAQIQLDSAIQDLVQCNFMPVIEHLPIVGKGETDILSVFQHDNRKK